MHISNAHIKAHVVRYFRILFGILTYCSCFTTLFPSMPPRAPQGGSRRPPRSPQKHPEKAHIKHFFFFQICFIRFSVFCFFSLLSDFCLLFLARASSPRKTPREAPTQEAPGGTQRRPQEAPQETARRKPPEGQDGPVMCMICAALCAAIPRAQGGPTCSQCSQQC